MNQKYLYLLIAFFLGLQSFKASATKESEPIATVGEGKFVTIPYENIIKGNELPIYATQINVGKNYANTSFNVKIEYPEYEKLNAQEVLAIIANKKEIGEDIKVNSIMAVQRKEGVLDISFLPYIKRNEVYYRLKSCKIAVYRNVSAQARKTQDLTSGSERYAQHSVLSSGKWVRIRVNKEGVYQLTKSFLASAGFSNPANVKLYGYGGLVQDSVINYSGDKKDFDDLEEIPLYRDGSKILFYANGTTKWIFVRNKWRHINNPYSSYSYYFLTEGDNPATMQNSAEVTAYNEARTTIPAHSLYEEDTYSWYSGGQQFFDSYDFANGNSKSYQLGTEEIANEGEQYVTISFSASDASSATNVTSSVNSESLGRMTIPLLNNTNVGEQGNRARMLERTYKATTLDLSNSVHFTTTSGHSARLDYIRFNYQRNLNLSTPYFELCDPSNNGAGNYTISSANNNTKVWRLGISGRPQQNVEGSLSGNTLNITLPESSDRYIVVNTAETFPSPTIDKKIENQDLHADSVCDMIIIVPASGKLTKQAERLAAAHREHDNLSVKVVSADQIYNEFSSGTPDAMAYRRYVKMLYDRASSQNEIPRYLLLFGDAAWDNRMITKDWQNSSPDDFLLCYESWNSINEIYCYVTDDFFGFLDDGEGKNMTSEKPDIAIGRIPTHIESEAKAVVDKTINYMYNNSVGSWKNLICVMGDDDKKSNSLMEDAETIVKQIESNHKEYDVRRVYWDAYTVVKTSTGNSYPEITKQLKSYMTNGALLMNYTGHGAPASISHEKVLLLNDFKGNKTNNLSVWITSSCEIAPFDSQEESIGECAVLNEKGGSVAFIGATRSVFSQRNLNLNTNLMRYILTEENGKLMTMGEALMKTKCALVSTSTGSTDFTINKMKYVLMGDPALRLAAPIGKVVIDSINGQKATGAKVNLAAGSVAKVKGHIIAQNGTNMPDFNGTVTANIFDKLEQITCHDNAGNGKDPLVFSNRTRRLFEGTDSVRNGMFEMEFPVSVDASYSNESCLMNLYAVSNDKSAECHGMNDNFAINSSTDLKNDSTGPALFIYLNNPDFRNGDKTNTTPYFVAMLRDSDGINATGSGVGHDIELIIDGNAATSYVLNDYFKNDFGTFTSGSVGYSIPELSPGNHRLVFRAWDMMGNSSSASLDFVAMRNLKPNVLDVTCNPNPATETAIFNISYDRPLTDVKFTVTVYDSYGQIVWKTTTNGESDYGHYPITWNLTNSAGARVGGGVYLYRVSVSEGNGAASTKTKKLIILNNK